jgi:hypothetical protein
MAENVKTLSATCVMTGSSDRSVLTQIPAGLPASVILAIGLITTRVATAYPNVLHVLKTPTIIASLVKLGIISKIQILISA